METQLEIDAMQAICTAVETGELVMVSRADVRAYVQDAARNHHQHTAADLVCAAEAVWDSLTNIGPMEKYLWE